MHPNKAWKLLTLLILLISCGELNEGEEDSYESSTLQQEILNGNPYNTSAIKAISLSPSNCSGMLLSNNWAISAAHCFEHSFDKTFSTNGMHTINDSTQTGEKTRALAINKSTGESYLVANLQNNSVGPFNIGFRVYKLTTSGTTDTSYGSNGVFTYNQSGSITTTDVSDAVLDENGNLFIVGTTTYNNAKRMTLWKLLPNGALDTSFSGDGIRIPGFNSATEEVGTSIALSPSGKIVIGGSARIGGKWNWALIRLFSNSNLDTTFDSDGKVLVDFSSAYGVSLTDLAVDPYNSDISVVGDVLTSNSAAFAKIKSDGSLDTSYDYDGKAYLNVPGMSSNTAKSVKIETISGDTIIALETYSNRNYFSFTRLNWSQTPNTNLNINSTFGYKSYDLDRLGQTPKLEDMDLYSLSDKTPAFKGIVAVGFIQDGGKSKYAYLRLNFENGNLDDIYTPKLGYWRSNFTNSLNSYGKKVATMNNGQFMIAGYDEVNSTGNFNLSVARYNKDFSKIQLQPTEQLDWVRLNYGPAQSANQQIYATWAFIAPQIDVVLFKASSNFLLNGTTNSHSLPIYAGTNDSLVNSDITCYGFGANSPNGASLPLVIDFVDYQFGGTNYIATSTISGAGLCGGDSGSGCLNSSNQLVGVNKGAYDTNLGNGNCFESVTQVGAQSFRNWALNIMNTN